MTDPLRSVVLHGHFYQPPREDPWTGEVPEQPSAAPFHDWNQRIERECYAPVTRCGTPETFNALEWMSFDFGPTLLVWLERYAPDTHRAVVEADRASVLRLGHGNALAMPFHHPILPLSSARDRTTEIRWGIADFRRRFGRDPEGMWLPETAVDDPTLDALAAEGIRFTVLAPHQVDPVPPEGRPIRYVTRAGREIALFVYDGGLSHGVAFGGLLEDGIAWARRMVEDGPGTRGPVLRSIATDGETFGHHHTFGEMALARAIVELRDDASVRVENYASFLARHGAREVGRLVAPSAWSCAHGVERWRSACGCRADPSVASDQSWRAPLRSSLEWLATRLHEIFEAEAGPVLGDPWAARDAYGAVASLGEGPFPGTRYELAARRFVGEWAGEGAAPTAAARALDLLEMERNALRFFTSCAWFFDDVGGLEPRQVLQYAGRALELAGPRGHVLRAGFAERLRDARSNDPEIGTAADLFEREAVVRSAARR